MATWQKSARTISSQKIAEFTGEGAYHGSTKSKPSPSTPRPPTKVVPEAQTRTIEQKIARGETTIELFEACFPNRLQLVKQLPVPSQAGIQNDGVTFCWCEFDEALHVAGPVTQRVLLGMQPNLTGTKRHIYVDSKIQYFEVGDLPVDSTLWHIDGSPTARNELAEPFGFIVAHDMRARLEGQDLPTYLAYQSSDNCATEFINSPLPITIPEIIPNFNAFDATVRAAHPSIIAHPAGAILAYDGLSLHRAIPAISPGWRLWIRLTETDVEIHPSAAITECYGTVFRPRA